MRPSATRTVAVLTPVCSAIAASVSPSASSAWIRAITSSVSLLGPFGPTFAGTSPATPCAVNACRHRHSVA